MSGGDSTDSHRAVSPVVGGVLLIGLVLLVVLAVANLAFGVTDRLDETAFQNDEDACPGFKQVEFEAGGSDFSAFLDELRSNNCALWLKGGSFAASNGTASEWTDEGPNAFHAKQGDPDSRPEVVFDSDLGTNVLEFEANHSQLDSYGGNSQPPSGVTDGDHLTINRDVEALGVNEGSGFVITAVLKVDEFDRGGAWTVGDPGQDGREFSMRTCSDHSFDGCKHTDPTGHWRGQHWGKTDIDFSSGADSDDEWLVLTHAYDGAAEEAFIRVNGEEVARAAIDLNLSANRDVQLGRWVRIDSDPHYYFDGRIAEVAVFDRSLAGGELDTVERYMSSTYGIDLDGTS